MKHNFKYLISFRVICLHTFHACPQVTEHTPPPPTEGGMGVGGKFEFLTMAINSHIIRESNVMKIS